MPYHRLTAKWPQYLLINALLIILIFCNAEMGKYLGIKSVALPISIVWPATGFALAALLLFDKGVWPGIFLGNFFYNIHVLYLNEPTLESLTAALFISIGSLLQALVANLVIRKYSSPNYLQTVKDVLVFLVPGGILPCLIASTIGTAMLYMHEGMSGSWAFIRHVWLTFWIGDTMGVYVITPFIIVWSLHKFNKNLLNLRFEGGLIAFFFIAIALLTIYVNFTLGILYILLGVMVTYKFGMHGATLGNLLITFLFIAPFSSVGYPSYPTDLVHNPLLFFVLLLETIVAVTLVFAASRK